MSNIPNNLKYTKQHEWVKMDGDVATVGITDHAQEALGDLVFVELPQVGKQVKQDDSIIVVESVKAASDVYAPLSGEITEVNEALSATPEQINSAPYDAGWICKIKVSNASDAEGLLDAAAYKEITD